MRKWQSKQRLKYRLCRSIIAVFMFYRVQRFGFKGRRKKKEERSFVVNISENRYKLEKELRVSIALSFQLSVISNLWLFA